MVFSISPFEITVTVIPFKDKIKSKFTATFICEKDYLWKYQKEEELLKQRPVLKSYPKIMIEKFSFEKKVGEFKKDSTRGIPLPSPINVLTPPATA